MTRPAGSSVASPRVSTDGQTLAAQNAQLTAAGCAKILSEKVSGAKTDRAELAKVLKRLEAGDILMVIQRLAEGATQADLARSYRVSQATISRLNPSPFGQSAAG